VGFAPMFHRCVVAVGSTTVLFTQLTESLEDISSDRRPVSWGTRCMRPSGAEIEMLEIVL